LAKHVAALAAIAIPEEAKTMSAETAAAAARHAGIFDAAPCGGLDEALDLCLAHMGDKPARILITGSLYLSGVVLRNNG
jgi:dihydrofolate synthase/folylpolyglutamate synthase